MRSYWSRLLIRDLSCAASEAASLFSGQAYLPLFSALDGVMDKFVSNDLVRYAIGAQYTVTDPHLVPRKYPLIFGPWREVGGAYVPIRLLQLAVCAEFRCRGTLIPLPLVFSSQHRQVLEGLVGPTAIAASHDSEQLGLSVLTLTLRTHRRQLEVTGQATLDERCSRCNHALVVALMRMTLIRELQTWTIVHW